MAAYPPLLSYYLVHEHIMGLGYNLFKQLELVTYSNQRPAAFQSMERFIVETLPISDPPAMDIKGDTWNNYHGSLTRIDRLT